MRNPSSTTSSSSPLRQTAAATTTTTTPCCSKIGIKRGPWTPEEDEILSNYIKKDGEGRWRTLPKRAGLLRCGKSCRLRWMNYLRPCVKRGQIAPDEEDLILRLHRLLGNRWSLIAGRIPGRTDNEIKNYWNTHLSKKLISQGIDPRTHKPLVVNPIFENNKNDYSRRDPKLSSLKSKNIVHVQVNPSPNPPNSEHENIRKNKHGYYEDTNLVDQEYETGTGGIVINNNGDDHDDVNYCTDDVFSTFLNTLINEDVYIGGQNQQAVQQPQAGSSDAALISSSQAFGFSGTGWENAIMSSTSMPSTSAFNNQINDQKKL